MTENPKWKIITETYKAGHKCGQWARVKNWTLSQLEIEQAHGNPHSDFMRHNVWKAGFQDGARA